MKNTEKLKILQEKMNKFNQENGDYCDIYKLWENYGKTRIYKNNGRRDIGYIDLETLKGFYISWKGKKGLNSSYFEQEIKILKELQ